MDKEDINSNLLEKKIEKTIEIEIPKPENPRLFTPTQVSNIIKAISLQRKHQIEKFPQTPPLFYELSHIFYEEIRNEIESLKKVVSSLYKEELPPTVKKKIKGLAKKDLHKIVVGSPFDISLQNLNETRKVFELFAKVLNENLQRFVDNVSNMSSFSQCQNVKLVKLATLKHSFNLQTAKDLSFLRLNRFPFECEDSDLFLNFKFGRSLPLLDPCLLYIPLKEECVDYDLSFFEYKQSSILKEVLVLKFYELHPEKGLHLKYLSYRLEEEIDFLPSLNDLEERVKFLEKKLLNRQVFALFKEDIEKFEKKTEKKICIVKGNGDISINLTEQVLLIIGFEKRDVLSNNDNVNKPEFYQKFLDIAGNEKQESIVEKLISDILTLLFMKLVNKGLMMHHWRKKGSIKTLKTYYKGLDLGFYLLTLDKMKGSEKEIALKKFGFYEKDEKGEHFKRITLKQIKKLFCGN